MASRDDGTPLADGLRHRGHAVPCRTPTRRARRVTARPVNHSARPASARLQGSAVRHAVGSHAALVLRTRDRPDVVHAVTEGPLGCSALRVARRLGIPVTSSYPHPF
ncbi:MAG: glycosyltransferase [Uliginosibacterium sp.]|nr:glycosyltransferase [Uliginosibacterium sp.]